MNKFFLLSFNSGKRLYESNAGYGGRREKMKLIACILISLAVLSALCGCKPSEDIDMNLPGQDMSVSDNSPEPLPSDTAKPEKELPYAFILSPDFDRSEGITIPDFEKLQWGGSPVVFDFGELAWDILPLGEWTADELVEKYGETDDIKGEVFQGKIYVGLRWWLDKKLFIYVQMATEKSDAFSFVTYEEHERYPLTTEDRAISMQITEISIFGESMLLPRGLKIGQSVVEDVRDMYPVVGSAGGFNDIYYNYVFFDEIAAKGIIEKSDIGKLAFSFKDNSVLYCVEITLP